MIKERKNLLEIHPKVYNVFCKAVTNLCIYVVNKNFAIEMWNEHPKYLIFSLNYYSNSEYCKDQNAMECPWKWFLKEALLYFDKLYQNHT